MRRIAFFQVWDRDGIIDDYVFSYIRGLKSVAERIVVTVNGKIQPEYLMKIYSLTNDVYIRPNIGLDAGGAKDSIHWFRCSNVIDEYDELIIANDSCYGPIFPFEEAFAAFENKDVDFWSMVEIPETNLKRNGEEVTIPHHMQGFFYTVRKSMFNDFLDWVESLEYAINLWKAALTTEFPIAEYFEKKGYKWKSYMSVKGMPFDTGRGQVFENSYDMVSKYRMPLIKKRIVNPAYFNVGFPTITYIKENSEYDVAQIFDNVHRTEMSEINVHGYNSLKLKDFCKQHKRIFIYGRGNIGSSLGAFFEHKGWEYNGYVVTDGEASEDTMLFRDLELCEGDGFVLGISYDSEPYYEVLRLLESNLQLKDIFLPRA